MISPYNLLKPNDIFTQPLSSLKGIGPKKAAMLAKRGLSTLLDLLFFLPLRYEDRTRITSLGEAGEGAPVLVNGRVLSGREIPTGRRRLFRVVMEDDTGRLELVWFHYRKPHLERFAREGVHVAAYGTVRVTGGRKQIIHPDLCLLEGVERERLTGIFPVYPSVEGFSPQALRSLVRGVFERWQEEIADPVPAEIIQALGLPGLGASLRQIHLPHPESSVELLNGFRTQAHRRLVFQRFFEVMLNVAFGKRSRRDRTGKPFGVPATLSADLKNLLPFMLTGGQAAAVREIVEDLTGPRPMNRLLQGDVGCGKTAVAVVCAYVAVLNGFQVAVMVPTQVLARQHYDYFSSFSEGMGFRPALLTGGSGKQVRETTKERMKSGHYNVIIGTQSLIQEGVLFDHLGLVIIDEQHRFGVRQRAFFHREGSTPHVLIMTATPIPRTLAMAAYADMEVSTIHEHPKGRLPVLTRLVHAEGKREAFNEVKGRLCSGEQGLVICPVIDPSEEGELKNALDMYARLRKVFDPPFRVGLVHGRLPAEEKERVMEGFRRGEIRLLVGTTVIEVGIHAPGATFIVIEHPERFGLSQLHQLRGRVGRGSRQGLCLLMCSDGLSSCAGSRLQVLADCHDGLQIAVKDLQIRGQGELMGTRQAGRGELDLEELMDEPELFLAAKQAADRIIEEDPELTSPANRPLKTILSAGTRPLRF